MNLTIRKAVREDAETIIGFQQEMALETEGVMLKHETISNGVLAVFNDPSKGEYYIAEDRNRVIASLLITYEWSDWRNGDVWWFQSVYVLQDYRRRGIFRKMYDYIKLLTDRANVAGLRLYVEANNHTAQKTYEAMGMNGEHYKMYEWLRD